VGTITVLLYCHILEIEHWTGEIHRRCPDRRRPDLASWIWCSGGSACLHARELSAVHTGLWSPQPRKHTYYQLPFTAMSGFCRGFGRSAKPVRFNELQGKHTLAWTTHKTRKAGMTRLWALPHGTAAQILPGLTCPVITPTGLAKPSGC